MQGGSGSGFERPTLPDGLWAGLIAGALMALAWIGDAVARELSWQDPFALVVKGSLGGDFDPFAAAWLGLVVHCVFSAFFGAVFFRLIRTEANADRILLAGILYGAAIWVLMTYFVLPIANPAFRAYALEHPAWWCMNHLLYGASLFITPSIRGMTELRVNEGANAMNGAGTAA